MYIQVLRKFNKFEDIVNEFDSWDIPEEICCWCWDQIRKGNDKDIMIKLNKHWCQGELVTIRAIGSYIEKTLMENN